MDAIDYIIKNNIVKQLANDYMVTTAYKDDLIQEVYMVLLEYPKEKLNQIPEKQLKFFVAKIMKNLWFSKTSSFYRTYKRPMLQKENIKTVIAKDEGSDDNTGTD